MSFNAIDYNSLISIYREELNTSRLTDVYIPLDVQITIFRTYAGISQRLEENDVAHIHLTQTYTKHEGMYHNLFDIGNHGFKRTYLKVYDTLQSHTEHGAYVGWLVHI